MLCRFHWWNWWHLEWLPSIITCPGVFAYKLSFLDATSHSSKIKTPQKQHYCFNVLLVCKCVPVRPPGSIWRPERRGVESAARPKAWQETCGRQGITASAVQCSAVLCSAVLCGSLYAFHSMHFSLCISLYAFHPMHFTLGIPLYAFYSMHLTLYNSLYASHSMHFILCISLYDIRFLLK